MSPKKKQKIPKVTAPPPEPAPPPTRADVEAMFDDYLDSQIEHLTHGIADWKANRLDVAWQEHPGLLRSNLEWMDKFCEFICKLEVLAAIKSALTKPTHATLETVYEYELDSTIDRARFPSHSSSYMTNFITLCRTQAQGDVVKEMKGFVAMWKKAKEQESKAAAENYAAMCQRPEDNE